MDERKHEFEELRYYILTAIDELKERMQSIEEKLIMWRQQSLAETIELKTKISTGAAIISFAVSLAVAIVYSIIR